MDQQSVFQITLSFGDAKPIVIEPTAGQLTTDAGLLPSRQLNEQLGLTRRFANALTDVRAAVQVDHTFLEMVGPDLASQPTLSRFENAIDVRSFFRLEELLLEEFMASFKEPPRELTLDIDCFDDETHGSCPYYAEEKWRCVILRDRLCKGHGCGATQGGCAPGAHPGRSTGRYHRDLAEAA